MFSLDKKISTLQKIYTFIGKFFSLLKKESYSIKNIRVKRRKVLKMMVLEKYAMLMEFVVHLQLLPDIPTLYQI